jgi:hypothetical protein
LYAAAEPMQKGPVNGSYNHSERDSFAIDRRQRIEDFFDLSKAGKNEQGSKRPVRERPSSPRQFMGIDEVLFSVLGPGTWRPYRRSCVGR